MPGLRAAVRARRGLRRLPPPAVRRSPRRVAAFAYAFPTDRLLQRIKYGGRIALAEWAGAALAVGGASPRSRVASAAIARRVIVPLPLAASRQRERGFNQAREIAVPRRAGHRLAARGSARARRRGSAAGSRCRGRERHRNVRGAFAATVGRARRAHRARRRRHDHRRHARRGLRARSSRRAR